MTTTRVTHATPAAAFGHSAHRDWECDTKIPDSERNIGCKDLARQLVEDEPGRNINVNLIEIRFFKDYFPFYKTSSPRERS